MSNKNNNTIPKMDKWEISDLQIIHYIKPSTLEVAYLVAGLG